MKKQIRKETRWFKRDVQAFCIHHNFYTCGYTTEYNKMLAFVDSKNPTTTNIYKVAQDIMDHTDMNRLDTKGLELTDFMYLINAECVRTFFKIVD